MMFRVAIQGSVHPYARLRAQLWWNLDKHRFCFVARMLRLTTHIRKQGISADSSVGRCSHNLIRRILKCFFLQKIIPSKMFISHSCRHYSRKPMINRSCQLRTKVNPELYELVLPLAIVSLLLY